MPARRNKPGSTTPRPYIRLGDDATDILENPEIVQEWDDEELIRGRRRDKNGGWMGLDPKVIPMPVYRELWKRTLNTALDRMRENLVESCEVLVDLSKDKNIPAKDRIAAATYVVDRVMGPLQKTGIMTKSTMTDPETGKKWETTLDVAIVNGPDGDVEFE